MVHLNGSSSILEAQEPNELQTGGNRVVTDTLSQRIERVILARLESLPLVSSYAKARGWPFILAWIHRTVGILLVLYVLFHIYTLTSLRVPESYNAKMRIFQIFVFVILEWALAIPVIFHSFNGARLILYESFGNRQDEALRRWIWSLSAAYVLLLALMMIMGNQTVTPGFFWLTSLVAAASLTMALASRIWKTPSSAAWKLQRISAAFMLVMIPAHMLFMHLNLSAGHEASVVVARMQNAFIKMIDIGLVLSVLFHGGYGLVSIAGDYISSKSLNHLITLVVSVVMVVFAWVGIKLTITI